MGVDQPFSHRWLGGLVLSFASGDSDYSYRTTDGSAAGGAMSTHLTTVYPYGPVRWNDHLRLRGLLGVDFGTHHQQQNDGAGNGKATGELGLHMG
ncbi:MAG: hypothetical protein TQ37_08130 [Candidatus Synechococcus spongiarum 15L]|uniref:Autotransporter domain-containing protein n=1 Tax=Candidatus Synechococcus spongiarum 15L TaxID=1608419 RepID=A0A0G8ASS1_9SYNE|nr:MAG: hypothetical protein TQ37_08130 [Candidatus Synechococcus spongiarum 15L]